MDRFDSYHREPPDFEVQSIRKGSDGEPVMVRTQDIPADIDSIENRGNWPLIPWSRGPLSAAVINALSRIPGTFGEQPEIIVDDALSDDDFQLALYLCYEVHYRDLTPHDWEWDTDLLTFRARLERTFTTRLEEEVSLHHSRSPFDVATALDQLLFSARNRSVPQHFDEGGSLDQMRELCVHRSASFLREGDPQAFAIPRLAGQAKEALIAIQYDDVGSGLARRTHAAMFAATMVALGLDPTYGSYVEMLPGVTLAGVNLVSMFALHRKWRAALVGQVAIHEMSSAGPMQSYSRALERFGVAARGRRFYDAHADVDARHVDVARDRMVAGLLSAAPELGSQVIFGAAAMLLLEENFAQFVLSAWDENRSSLVPWEMTPDK